MNPLVVSVGDIGSKKARICVGDLLHGDLWQSASFPHALGRLFERNHFPAGSLTSQQAFLTFCEEWNQATPPQSGEAVSRQFISTSSPGRYHREHSPGEFPLAMFSKTGTFPLVISGRMEAVLMELAVWSEFTRTRQILAQHQKSRILHLHPGGLSFEANESSDGVLAQTAYIERFGVISEERSFGSLDDFNREVQKARERLTSNSGINALFGEFSQDAQLVISGRFARHLKKDLVANKINSENDFSSAKGLVSESDARSLVEELLSKIQSSTSPEKLTELRGKCFILSVILAAFEEVKERCVQAEPTIILSEARLVHGLIEFRRRGSFNEYLIPEAVEDFMECFFDSLYPCDDERKKAREIGGKLAHALTDPDIPPHLNSSRALAIDIAVQLGALDLTQYPNELDTLSPVSAHQLFAANRVPGMSRKLQEAIVVGLDGNNHTPHEMPQHLDRVGHEVEWIGGFARGVTHLHRIIAEHGDGRIDIQMVDEGKIMHVMTNEPAVLHGWEKTPKATQAAIADGLQLSEIAFQFRS